VADLLKRHDVGPAPEQGKTTSWREFIQSHLEVLAAVDFFTAEVWTTAGLTTYHVLTSMRVASRQVCIAGVTPWPDQRWMVQMARNVTMETRVFWADADTFCTIEKPSSVLLLMQSSKPWASSKGKCSPLPRAIGPGRRSHW
jgi:hypothetical protein